MPTTIKLKLLYNKFVPISEFDAEEMEGLKQGIIYKAVLTHPRLNSDNPSDEQRTGAQNRLLWRWYTDMSKTDVNEYAGSTKEDWHYKMKRIHLAVIFERDDAGYAATINAIREVYKQKMKTQAETMFRFIVENTTTTQASVSQFSEYLKCIESFCLEKNIRLSANPDLYKDAIF